MTPVDVVDAPDLPELEAQQLRGSGAASDLSLSGALVIDDGSGPVTAHSVDIEESELRGVTLDAGNARGLVLTDVILRDCDFSNVQAREGSIRRSEIRSSRLVGFALSEGTIRDLRVVDAAMTLALFAHTRLERVAFESVNLREASFMEAQLEAVSFIDCDLAGADFRGAKLKKCVVRGSSLDEVIGVESLSGLTMPWPDVVSSAGALAAALGITVESD
jgi:uncharacterized protein YjbI with pentapeptide repeats